MWNTDAIRSQFPILQSDTDTPLVYLDNAATTQKPEAVLQAMDHFYRRNNANVHRGIYPLAYRATVAYENARERVRAFLHARDHREIVFVRGATEGINLAAHSFLADRLQPGDEVLITAMEHHANLVPWQQLCTRKSARLRVIPMWSDGSLQLDQLDNLMNERTQMVAVVHISNSLGTINPIDKIIKTAQGRGIPVLIDAAQSAAYYPLDVQALGCDFLVFSGHKIFGPMGVGVLYGRMEHLREMSPYQTGGEMIRSVSFDKTTFAAPPKRFEAGTPNVAGAVGLAAAIQFIEDTGQDRMRHHLETLLQYATEKLESLEGLRIIGQAPKKSGIISFQLGRIHPHDLATWLGEAGVCVRAGHHCTQPVMDFFEAPATVRVSFSIYNTTEEVDILVKALREAATFFNS
jgi:cysteine desulfurase/selenocysteine lyase